MDCNPPGSLSTRCPVNRKEMHKPSPLKGVTKLQSISQKTSNKPIFGVIIITATIYWVLTTCQTPCWALHMIFSFHPHNHPVTTFRMRKLRLREVDSFALSHTASQWWSLPSNPGLPSFQSMETLHHPASVIIRAWFLGALPLAVESWQKWCSRTLITVGGKDELERETLGLGA